MEEKGSAPLLVITLSCSLSVGSGKTPSLPNPGLAQGTHEGGKTPPCILNVMRINSPRGQFAPDVRVVPLIMTGLGQPASALCSQRQKAGTEASGRRYVWGMQNPTKAREVSSPLDSKQTRFSGSQTMNLGLDHGRLSGRGDS